MFKILSAILYYLIIAKCTNLQKENFDLTRAVGVKLLNSAEYMLNVSQLFIYELEDYGICNTKIQDFEQKISRLDYFGYEVNGTVKYTNGFIDTLQEVSLQQTPQDATIDDDENTANMTMKLKFTNMMIFYDYHAYLTKGNFSGTVSLPLDSLEIIISVKKYFSNNTIIHEVIKTGNGRSLLTSWEYIPSNHYTEIINKDVKFNFSLSEKNLEATWSKVLGRVVPKLLFPEICFMC